MDDKTMEREAYTVRVSFRQHQVFSSEMLISLDEWEAVMGGPLNLRELHGDPNLLYEYAAGSNVEIRDRDVFGSHIVPGTVKTEEV